MKKSFLLPIFTLLLASCIQQQDTAVVFESGNSNPGRSVASVVSYTQNMQMAERSYTSNVLKQVFDVTAGSADDTYINTKVYQVIQYGGACDPYEASDLGVATLEFAHENCGSIGPVQASTGNPMRFALTTKICEDLVARTTTFNALKPKLFNSGNWETPSDESVLKAWKLFYPLEPLDPSLSTALKDIKSATANDTEAWKAIVLTICSSPGWQVI